MANSAPIVRPTFDQAVTAWKALLRERKLPDDLCWVFDENLCFEKDPANQSGFRLGYQTALTPPPPDAERIAYHHFCEHEAPIVFYRVGTSNGRSVCLVLGDEWFEGKTEAEGYSKRNEWLISFRPGTEGTIEEITDKQRWENRILRDRPLHDLDFCMTLQAVHETLAHGHVLTAYDRYALKFLHVWRRFLRHQS